jgi:hypothetical protein
MPEKTIVRKTNQHQQQWKFSAIPPGIFPRLLVLIQRKALLGWE